MRSIVELRALSKKFKFKDTSLYLIFGMICISLYSLLLPLFGTPDELYHFDCSAYISNTVVDRNYIAKTHHEYPGYIKQSIKEKRYIKSLFFTKVKIIDRELVNDQRAKHQKGYEFWGHVIPAIGRKLGFYIYPSVGVMIFFSRIFSGIIYLLCLFFIVKNLAYGKKIFMALSLTPTMLPLLASMNYDGLNFVITAFFVMTMINISIKNKNSLFDIVELFISSILVFFCAKTNMILLLFFLLIPLCKFFVSRFLNRKLSSQFLYLSIFIFLGFIGIFYAVGTKLVTVNTIIKIFNTITYPGNLALSSEILGGNLMFTSLILGWYWTAIVVFLLVSNEGKIELKTKVWALIAIFIYFLNIIVLLVAYQNFPDIYLLSKNIIGGVQGRYIIPYILPLAMINVSFNKGLCVNNRIKDFLIFGSAIISTIMIIYAAYVYV